MGVVPGTLLGGSEREGPILMLIPLMVMSSLMAMAVRVAVMAVEMSVRLFVWLVRQPVRALVVVAACSWLFPVPAVYQASLTVGALGVVAWTRMTRRKSPDRFAATAEPTTLYRYYDEAGRLLYVGISNDALRRMGQHAAKDWAPQVRSWHPVHFATRAEAEAAERHAIRTERPVYNIAHARA